MPVKHCLLEGSSDIEVVFIKHYLGETYIDHQKSNLEEIKELFSNVEAKYKQVVVEEDFEVIQKLPTTADIVTCTPKSVLRDEESWERIDVDTSITDTDIASLMVRAANNHYQAFGKEEADEDIHLRCASLFRMDYKCLSFSNIGGALCWNYPENIIVPIAVKIKDPNSSNESAYDESSRVPGFEEEFKAYHEMARSAAIARCRSRFPVPVILYKGKFICRSGTLAVRKGAAFEAARKAAEPESQMVDDQFALIRYIASKGGEFCAKAYEAMSILLTGVDDMKDADVNILKMLRIRYICDLMVENRKIHTGMSVGSSEKINMIKYGEFGGLRVPYPGCEFFRDYNKIRSSPEYEEEKKNLIYDWNAPEVDSFLGLSEEENLPFPELEWESYREWDLVTLTKNYIRLLLHFLEEGDGGLLVHCISGWDRTPLFISLLRISLWADNLIHKDLSVHQMAYFTLGYDWYLFGHDLPNRIKKREEIMHFCFKFLPEIASDEYSLNKGTAGDQNLLRNRQTSIVTLSRTLLRLYEENILVNPLTSSYKGI